MKFDGGESYAGIDHVCGRLVHEIPLDDQYARNNNCYRTVDIVHLPQDILI